MVQPAGSRVTAPNRVVASTVVERVANLRQVGPWDNVKYKIKFPDLILPSMSSFKKIIRPPSRTAAITPVGFLTVTS